MVFFSLFSDGGQNDGLGDLFGSSSQSSSSSGTTPSSSKTQQSVSSEQNKPVVNAGSGGGNLSVSDLFSDGATPSISSAQSFSAPVADTPTVSSAGSFGGFTFSPPSEASSSSLSFSPITADSPPPVFSQPKEGLTDAFVVGSAGEVSEPAIALVPDVAPREETLSVNTVGDGAFIAPSSDKFHDSAPIVPLDQAFVASVSEQSSVSGSVIPPIDQKLVDGGTVPESIAAPIPPSPVTRDGVIVPDLPPLHQHASVVAPDVVISSVSKKKQEASITTLEDVAANAERKPDVKQTISSRKRISVGVLLSGCIGFVFLLLLGVGGSLFFFLSHPEQLNGIMDQQTVSSLLKIITTVFFGFMFFAGFAFLTLNLYRLIVLKNVAKLGYGLGSIAGLLILVFSIVLGKVSLDTIYALQSEQQVVSDDLLFMYLPLRQGFTPLHSTPGLRVIAPINAFFELNESKLQSTLVTQLGTDKLSSITLDCGNGQKLSLIKGSYKFDGSCYFLKKGVYEMNIIFDYTSRQSGAPGSKSSLVKFTVDSEVLLSTSQGSYALNDSQSEISFGQAPQRLFLDARNIFTDLALPSYGISWDVDDDEVYDNKDLSSIVARFSEPGTHTVYYTIPDIGDYVYPLTFKVEQSDVPICSVALENIKGVTYNIIANCDAKNGPVVKYDFAIIDEKDGKSVDVVSSKRPQVKYDFPARGNFTVRLSHATQDGKIGYAESDSLDIGDVDFTVSYDMLFREANDKQRRQFDETTDHTFSKTEPKIELQRLPVRLQLTINGVIPVLQGTEVTVFLGDEPIIASSDGKYAMTLTEPDNQSLRVLIKNTQAQSETTMIIPIEINQPKIIPDLKVGPDYVGESPFTVTFDASATSVSDPEDSIVFFSWDFGDGKINKNTSQGIIQHQYTYDDEQAKGVYNPTVSVTTKKGLNFVVHLDNPITITKPTQRARINIDSHPSQSAFVGEDVVFSVRTDGVIDSVLRDFDDGETILLNGRQGIEVMHPFVRPGRYKVRAQVTYDNKTITSPTITLVVNEEEPGQ